MKFDDLRSMLDKDAFQPFLIKAKGGRSYPVRHESSIWMPTDDFESLVCVAVRGKGVTLLDIESIESVHIEVELAARP